MSVSAILNGAATANAWDKVATGYGTAIDTLQQTNNNIQTTLAPYKSAATTGINDLQQSALGTSTGDVKAILDASVNNANSAVKQALEQSAAARGGNISGAMAGLTSYATGVADQNWNSAAKIAQTNTQQKMTAAGTLLDIGHAAIQTGAGYASEAGQAIAADQVNYANAKAGGITGAWNSMYGGASSSGSGFSLPTSSGNVAGILAAGAAGLGIAGIAGGHGNPGESSGTPGDGSNTPAGGSEGTDVSGSGWSASSFTPSGIGVAIGNYASDNVGGARSGWATVGGIIGGLLGGPGGAIFGSAIGQSFGPAEGYMATGQALADANAAASYGVSPGGQLGPGPDSGASVNSSASDGTSSEGSTGSAGTESSSNGSSEGGGGGDGGGGGGGGG